MRRRQTIAALALVMTSACATGPGETPDNPIRIVRPTREEIMHEYPPEALRQGIRGSAIVECQIVSPGVLDRCLAISENPAGHGFGDAAIRVAFEHFVRPDAQGRYGAGRIVRVPVDFIPPR